MLYGPMTHPQFLRALAAAGHGSKVLLADANYPHTTGVNPRCELVSLNLAPGLLDVSQVLDVLKETIPIERAEIMTPAPDAEPVEIPERFPFYSLVNITGTARGITETGCKFPLDNGEIHCGYQYGTSNEVLPGQIAVVSVKEGLLLLIKDFPET